jgi:2-polyprenyl-6-methoxyphenol hydroxylase-like FAD-dependent oxidoreductase
MKPKNIMIVGGGTAGWLSALMLAKAWAAKNIVITLVESPDVGIIGVGEGSTPALAILFERLGFDEKEWMSECNATYKCGIEFKNWSGKTECENYFHPFSCELDSQSFPVFMQHVHARKSGKNVYAKPDKFFLTALLAQQQRAPKSQSLNSPRIYYGYHFDASLLGKYLARKAAEVGVIHKQLHISHIEQNNCGDISAIKTSTGELLTADFFIDCTGFASLLLQKTLGSKFHSYASQLFNNAAVTMPTEITRTIPSQTLSTAMNHGWVWKIPLTNRFGNGYVYSQDFCSADQAETELRAHLGLLDKDVPVRHLKMKVGRVTQHWKNNCVGVGLSQGFIEPLEATALYLVQQTMDFFIEAFEKGNFTARYQELFNKEVNAYFDGIRDYIVTHYKTSARTDTEYWRANTADPRNVSPVMKELYGAWFRGENIAEVVKLLEIDRYYPAPSWYCILAGMGIWGNGNQQVEPASEMINESLDSLLKMSSSLFQDHRAWLQGFTKI